jgi:anaerobic selenocysteine-containing dehydrogenase
MSNPGMKTRFGRSLSRREFLKVAGAAGVGVAVLGHPLGKVAASTLNGDEWRQGIEQWIPSVCHLCPGKCGILCRVVDGRLVKIEGNPYNPINRGRLCPVGQAGLQVLYSPDRLRNPLTRDGPRGSGRWKAISWDEAEKRIAERLGIIRSVGQPHSLAIVDGSAEGSTRTAVAGFARGFGTPNHIVPERASAVARAAFLTQGIEEPCGYDMVNSNYILSFGCSLLESWDSPVEMHGIYGYLTQERTGKKAKIVQVDTRFSVTAAKADEWIPIKPGTYGILALGIAYVIIREKLYDEDFIRRHTSGFGASPGGDGRTPGFLQKVMEEYRPDTVSVVTGVPIDTILRVAKEFAQNKPAVAVVDRNTASYSNGTFNACAVQCVNALVGGIDAPGGTTIRTTGVPNVSLFLDQDDVAKAGLSKPRIDAFTLDNQVLNANSFAGMRDNVIRKDPYEIDTIVFVNSNPLFDDPLTSRSNEALSKIPFVVSITPFMDETAENADMVLPESTYLERWENAFKWSMGGIPVVGLTQPVVSPVYETKSVCEIMLRVAKEVGMSSVQSVQPADSLHVTREGMKEIFTSQKGTVFAHRFEELHIRALEERGWWTPMHNTFDEFWSDVLKKGGWWEPHYNFGEWGRVLRTPTRRFEFVSEHFRLDSPYPEFTGDVNQYPLHLNLYTTLTTGPAASSVSPWLLESLTPILNVKWDSWAEINPDTAQHYGISDGEFMWVESPYGKFKVMARVYKGAMPGSVYVPTGLGHVARGLSAKGVGVNPNPAVADVADVRSGVRARCATMVKIYRV